MAAPKNLAMAGAPSFAQEAYSPGRYEILRALELEPLRFTDVVAQVDLSEGEVTRNLRRLADAGLVAKDLDGRFAPTPLGSAALVHGAGLDVLGRYSSLWSNVALDGVPAPLLRDIGVLGKARLITDPFESFQVVQDLFDGVRTLFLATWIIGEQALSDETREMQRRLAQRLETASDARGVLLHREWPFMATSPAIGRFHVRLVANLATNVVVTDSGALLQFTRRSGEVDFGHTFVGEHPDFTQWCTRLFESDWERGDAITGAVPVGVRERARAT